ncbi:hypothetical protein A2468_00845, partial [Candidatus Falkowbacteria bacterium RIFOXYC2_FULL_46_15]
MKILICTQKVDLNDDILGFFHSWIAEFVKHCEKVTVICLCRGEYDLPGNVKILSLGKEEKSLCVMRYALCVTRLKYIARFYRYIWRERKNYDKIFVHMNSEYVVLGGWLWKLWNKKIGLWYVHKAIPWQLKIAEKFVGVIFTASRESCNLASQKIKVVGHGIDLRKFEIRNLKLEIGNIFKIIYVGRISPIKNQELLIGAIDILRRDTALPRLSVKLIGGTIYEKDEEYLGKLKNLVKEKKLGGVVEFVGSVPNKDINKYYSEADLAVNLCPTGGVDKAVLEAMAAGLPVIVFNKTFENILGEHKEEMILREENAEELAGKI